MDVVLQVGALACTLLGLVSTALVLVRNRGVRLPLGVLLDFLLAAGLLRLAAHPSPRALASAALVVAVRKVATLGLTRPRGSRVRRLASRLSFRTAHVG